MTQGQSGTMHERRSMLLMLLGTIVVGSGSVELRLDPIRLASALLGQQVASSAPSGDPIILTAPLVLKRIGYELRLIVEGTAAKAEPNSALIKLVVQAQRMRMQMLQEHLAVGELAGRNGLGGTYTTRLLRLSFLAPDIVAAILDGRQPLSFTANTLQRMDKLPFSWAEQRRIFGFG